MLSSSNFLDDELLYNNDDDILFDTASTTVATIPITVIDTAASRRRRAMHLHLGAAAIICLIRPLVHLHSAAKFFMKWGGLMRARSAMRAFNLLELVTRAKQALSNALSTALSEMKIK